MIKIGKKKAVSNWKIPRKSVKIDYKQRSEG